jgi:hypothetical protein
VGDDLSSGGRKLGWKLAFRLVSYVTIKRENYTIYRYFFLFKSTSPKPLANFSLPHDLVKDAFHCTKRFIELSSLADLSAFISTFP